MTGMTVGVETFKFHEILGRDAEFVYGAAPWLPELVEVRAGGLIPIARQYPGAREFVEAYRSAFPGADLTTNSAAAYGACQVLVEAVRRTGSLDVVKSATPSRRWTATRSTAGSESIGMDCKSDTRT